MRLLLAMLAIAALPAVADDSPASITFKHECKSIDPVKSGFRCYLFKYHPYGMVLERTEHPDHMTPERRALVEREMSRMMLLYYSLGSTRFQITFPNKDPLWRKVCFIRSPDRVGCSDMICEDAEGKRCKRKSEVAHQ